MFIYLYTYYIFVYLGGFLNMNGYYWKSPVTGKWSYRENKKSENWIGQFNSRAEAKEERLNKRASYLKDHRMVLVI